VTTPPPPRRTPLRAPSTPVGVETGRLLQGRYRLGTLVASGGMAQVWEGTDEVLRRRVAVKVLHPHLAADATFVTRFRHEAVAAARLAHPGIVAIYDTCSDDGVEAIVMELVQGHTLRDRLDDPAPIDPWHAAGLAAQVADALEAAHRAGLVHRDVKPANILLCGDGRVKVADFGIAKAVAEADLTQPGLMVGTAKYLAPEQVRGDPVDPRTDIYSLGVVLYEMLCGRAPFVADTDAATALARLTRDPLRPRQVRASVPRALEDVVGRAMAREPAQRYASASDLRAALLASGAATATESDLTGTMVGVPRTPPPAGAPIPPPPGPATAVEGTPAPTFRQSERATLIPTILVVLVAVALGVAGLLLGKSGAFHNVREALGGSGGGAAVPIASATPFDPKSSGGDGRENAAGAPLAIDGKADTGWKTEGYNSRDITVLKDGVGLVLRLDSARDLSELQIDSPTNDWTVAVYIADSPGATLAEWGDPVVTKEHLQKGTNKIALHDAHGAAVLVWILDRGDAAGRAGAELDEVRLLG
jgi:tRNA A-37 threonylcarbamoyl transferase component Bud32